LENEEQAIARVAQRVKNGGHGIPEEDIRRRFTRGIFNLINLYMPICDNVHVYNNAHGDAILVATHTKIIGKIQIYEQEMWNQFIQKV
jgi:predicted ABC-type ATPase